MPFTDKQNAYIQKHLQGLASIAIAKDTPQSGTLKQLAADLAKFAKAFQKAGIADKITLGEFTALFRRAQRQIEESNVSQAEETLHEIQKFPILEADKKNLQEKIANLTKILAEWNVPKYEQHTPIFAADIKEFWDDAKTRLTDLTYDTIGKYTAAMKSVEDIAQKEKDKSKDFDKIAALTDKILSLHPIIEECVKNVTDELPKFKRDRTNEKTKFARIPVIGLIVGHQKFFDPYLTDLKFRKEQIIAALGAVLDAASLERLLTDTKEFAKEVSAIAISLDKIPESAKKFAEENPVTPPPGGKALGFEDIAETLNEIEKIINDKEIRENFRDDLTAFEREYEDTKREVMKIGTGMARDILIQIKIKANELQLKNEQRKNGNRLAKIKKEKLQGQMKSFTTKLKDKAGKDIPFLQTEYGKSFSKRVDAVKIDAPMAGRTLGQLLAEFENLTKNSDFMAGREEGIKEKAARNLEAKKETDKLLGDLKNAFAKAKEGKKKNELLFDSLEKKKENIEKMEKNMKTKDFDFISFNKLIQDALELAEIIYTLPEKSNPLDPVELQKNLTNYTAKLGEFKAYFTEGYKNVITDVLDGASDAASTAVSTNAERNLTRAMELLPNGNTLNTHISELTAPRRSSQLDAREKALESIRKIKNTLRGHPLFVKLLQTPILNQTVNRKFAVLEDAIRLLENNIRAAVA
jgi:hypothetical protein